MNRRDFIKTSILAGVGISLFNSFIISCSGTSISLKDVIGKKEDLLNEFKHKKEGDSKFSYYVIDKFKDTEIKGTKVFIFCENSLITGYTIIIESTKNLEELIEKLNSLYGNNILVFSNEFGEEFIWKTKNKKINLSYNKSGLNLPENIFYSESDINSKLIVF